MLASIWDMLLPWNKVCRKVAALLHVNKIIWRNWTVMSDNWKGADRSTRMTRSTTQLDISGSLQTVAS